jgi:hypothetical protein
VLPHARKERDVAGSHDAWVGTARVNPEAEKKTPVGLGRAIANAAAKAGDVTANRGRWYSVSRIEVKVGNPGPTSYRVIITRI